MIKTCETCGGLYATVPGEAFGGALCMCSQHNDVRAENNRYREALEKISGCYPHELGEAYTMQRIAREALNKTTVGNEIYAITEDGIKAVQEHIAP